MQIIRLHWEYQIRDSGGGAQISVLTSSLMIPMLAQVWEALLWTMYLSWGRLTHMSLELNLEAPTPVFWNKFQKTMEKGLRTSYEYGLPAPRSSPWQGRRRASVRVPVPIGCCVNAFFFLSLHLKELLRSVRNNALGTCKYFKISSTWINLGTRLEEKSCFNYTFYPWLWRNV